MANELIVELKLELQDIKKELNTIKKEAGKAGDRAGDEFERRFKKSTAGLANSFRNLGKLAVGAFAAGAVVRGINAVVDAAQVQEDAINRLNVALKTSGDFSQQASRDFQDYASALQETTRFGDEVILNQLALAKSFGASNEQAKEIVSAATDLAEAFKIDLESATRNVAKTLGGFAGELGEVIPELKSLTQEQLQAGQGIDILAAKFKGTAGQSVQTFSGATAQLSNAFGDLLEKFGEIITKNDGFVNAIKGTTTAIGFLGDQVGKVANLSKNLFREESTKGFDVAQKKVSALRRELNATIDAAKSRREGFFGIAFEADRIAADKLDKKAEVLRVRLAKALAERNKIREQNKNASNQETANEINNDNKVINSKEQLAAKLGMIGLTRLQRLQQQQEQEQAIIAAAFETEQINEQEFNERRLESERLFLEQKQAILDESAMNAEATLSNVGAAWEALGRKTKNTAGQIASIANNVLARGIGNAFQKVGQALASNKSAMDAFAEGVKGIFADLASALGDYYIKVGIAEVAKTKGAFGWDTIAAGAGLKVLSGVLGSGGGGGGTGSAGAGTGGTGPATAGTDVLSQEPELAQQQQEQTVLNLNVQGSLVQQEELGQFIADTLSESGAKNDTVVTNFRSVG